MAVGTICGIAMYQKGVHTHACGQEFCPFEPRPGLFLRRNSKKQIQGSYRDDGKKIYVCSQVYGARSAHRGGCFDHYEVELLAQKVLSELARDAEKDTARLHRYKKAA